MVLFWTCSNSSTDVLRITGPDAVLQVGLHAGRVETRITSLALLATHSLDAAQDVDGLPGFKRALPRHAELISKHP